MTGKILKVNPHDAVQPDYASYDPDLDAFLFFDKDENLLMIVSRQALEMTLSSREQLTAQQRQLNNDTNTALN